MTWDAYLMFMFADQADERAHPDTIVDALSRPTAPYVEMSFGRGLKGFPPISMTQHAANKFAEWLSLKTGDYYRLPTEAGLRMCVSLVPAVRPPATVDDYAWMRRTRPLSSSRRRITLSARRRRNAGASTCSET